MRMKTVTTSSMLIMLHSRVIKYVLNDDIDLSKLETIVFGNSSFRFSSGSLIMKGI